MWYCGNWYIYSKVYTWLLVSNHSDLSSCHLCGWFPKTTASFVIIFVCTNWQYRAEWLIEQHSLHILHLPLSCQKYNDWSTLYFTNKLGLARASYELCHVTQLECPPHLLEVNGTKNKWVASYCSLVYRHILVIHSNGWDRAGQNGKPHLIQKICVPVLHTLWSILTL